MQLATKATIFELFGGRVRGHGLRDIDVLIVVPRGRARRGLVRDIMLRAMDVYGLPWDALVELHVVEEGGGEPYLRDAAMPIAGCGRGRLAGAPRASGFNPPRVASVVTGGGLDLQYPRLRPGCGAGGCRRGLGEHCGRV